MSDTDHTETSLKGKEFDEACSLVADDEHASVVVHQKDPNSNRWDFCFSLTPGEHDERTLLENLAADFGPGEYPVQIRSKTVDGQARIRWQKNMRVAMRRPMAQPAQSSTAASTDAFAIALDNQTRMLASVLEKISQPPATAPAPQQSRQDLLAELTSMKELFGGDQKNPLDMIRDQLELTKLVMESAGGDIDPLTKAINMFGPKIVEAIDDEKEAKRRASVPADRRLARPAQPAEPAKPAQPGAPDPAPKFAHIDVDSAYSIFAENYLRKLLELPADTDPQDLGRYLARQVGDNAQQLHVVGLVIEQDDMIERLAPFDARVRDRAEWLDSTADWLAHALWPDMNGPPDPENATNLATPDDKSEKSGITAGNGKGAHHDDDPVKTADEIGPGTSTRRLDNDP